jgi:hypothetical protein
MEIEDRTYSRGYEVLANHLDYLLPSGSVLCVTGCNERS